MGWDDLRRFEGICSISVLSFLLPFLQVRLVFWWKIGFFSESVFN